MPTARDTYEKLLAELREISLIGSVGSVLHWDERTQMPPKAAGHRAKQLSYLARAAHERFTAQRVGDWLAEVESSDVVADPASDAAVNVREARRGYRRAVKLPPSLVEQSTSTAVLGEKAWADARAANDFPRFAPWLDKMLDLKRQEAACIGSASGRPYDALLDEYEPGETSAGLQSIFDGLRPRLVELVGAIAASGRKAPRHILTRSFPVDAQRRLATDVAGAVGYDFAAGRLDTSTHPFSIDLGPGDSRITTRYDEHWFGDGFFGTLHETGHALYTQGLPAAHHGTPRGHYVSLGIHESQSRMWENLVGRGRPFWRHWFPRVKALFPAALEGVSEDDWHFAVNDIGPSPIRTEADEATYNLHVMLRFELEAALLHRDLAVRDLPGAWNETMRTFLGITPPDDARGCLQDVHWADGAIGYFPTYTLGNLYAAQFYEQADRDIPALDATLAAGDCAPLLAWLREHIHRHGQTHHARDLVKRVTGKPLSPEPLLRHLRTKARELYGVRT